MPDDEPAAATSAPAEPSEPRHSDLTGTSPVGMAAAGVVLGALLVAALVTLATLAGSLGDEPERIATISTTSPAAPTTTPELAPASTRDISITDEPIQIDAAGNIVASTDGASNAGEDSRVGDEPTTDAAGTDDTADTTADATVDDGRNLLGGDDPEDKLMPDVICFGLQDAQDEIQDHGVFGSKSQDASGKGRRQIWDRNWIVVDQRPAPGEKIGEFEAVLFVVKTDEDNDC